MEGFWDLLNARKWSNNLLWLEHEFEPTEFLQRKPNTAAPQGTARTSFLEALKAATNLLQQFQQLDPNGEIQPNPRFDQTFMLIHSLPILLLSKDLQPHRGTFTQVVNRRCGQFLRGEWRQLFTTAIEQQISHNEVDKHRSSKPSSNKQQQIALEQARDLNYSRAMNILRSSGPAIDSPSVILNSLQSLHPPDSAPLRQYETPFTVPLSSFNFIDGKWLGQQLRRSKRGTAVDQWGWDSREMWRDILKDQPFLDDVAKYWILPLAAGYLPERYQSHLAGGRLTALSKAPKPGIRPVNVPDVWRRLAAKGLLTHCLPELGDFFQKEHPRVFQFATACPDGAAKMFHLINGIAITCSLQQTHSSERLIIANLDLRNAFNEESRQLIYDFFASGCHTPPSQEASHHTWKGWDILWRHFEAHYSTPGLLKFYHSGQVHHISSKTGTQQGDPLGTVLFSAHLQRILHQVADAHPEILIFAFADNVCHVQHTRSSIVPL